MTGQQYDGQSAEPDTTAPMALLIIDMINDLEFPEGDSIFPAALAAAERIAALKQKAKAHRIPVIYANDNFGRWRSNFQQAVDHCLRGKVRGSALAKVLQPTQDDYFVLKPQHSAFYATPLELLLTHLDTRTLILTGISGHMCVQLTAADAYMRQYPLLIPADCVASHTVDLNQRSLEYMHQVLGADLTESPGLDLESLAKRDARERH